MIMVIVDGYDDDVSAEGDGDALEAKHHLHADQQAETLQIRAAGGDHYCYYHHGHVQLHYHLCRPVSALGAAHESGCSCLLYFVREEKSSPGAEA